MIIVLFNFIVIAVVAYVWTTLYNRAKEEDRRNAETFSKSINNFSDSLVDCLTELENQTTALQKKIDHKS